MLSLVQVTLVGGPPVVTQVKVNEGGSLIGSNGSNWNSMLCCRIIRPEWIMHIEHVYMYIYVYIDSGGSRILKRGVQCARD